MGKPRAGGPHDPTLGRVHVAQGAEVAQARHAADHDQAHHRRLQHNQQRLGARTKRSVQRQQQRDQEGCLCEPCSDQQRAQVPCPTVRCQQRQRHQRCERQDPRQAHDGEGTCQTHFDGAHGLCFEPFACGVIADGGGVFTQQRQRRESQRHRQRGPRIAPHAECIADQPAQGRCRSALGDQGRHRPLAPGQARRQQRSCQKN